MKLNKLSFFILISLLVVSCSGGGGGGAGGGGGTSTPAVTLTSIAVTPANPGMIPGTTKQFTATGTYSDNTTQNITTSVIWSSSNETVATIGTSSGLATAAAAGTTTITAVSGSITGSTQLTVQNDNDDNVLKVTVNGSLCSSSYNSSYPNKPCVSVTVCSPGTSTCQTIDDILLDTGASGLRIFKSLLTIPLTQVTSGSGSLTECIQFADGSADWGPVQLADIILGNEPAVTVPIQIIDSTFGSVPSSCGTPDSGPSVAKFNGILGVGIFNEDCGLVCTSVTNNKMYYSCSGSTCTPTKAPLSNQVQNPVSRLPADNNGVIVQLPPVPSGGAASVDGNLILGIGTRSNNTPSGVTMYPADPNPNHTYYGYFITVFNGITYSDSFIDSGSNGLFFNASSLRALTTCGAWYCPSSTQILSATTKGYGGSPSGVISFQIGNASTLFSSPNNVFIELGGANTSFDWGLPFFLGRNVYVGIDGKTSSLGTGPYWAY
jgi:hypothetical protein